MKKNDLFVDVSSHNGYDISGILEEMGTQNTVIKISESTSYINPCLSAQVEQSSPVGFYHFAWFGGDSEEAERLFSLRIKPALINSSMSLSTATSGN